jgi:glycosyltransferase involved in cell wall biosynthesis
MIPVNPIYPTPTVLRWTRFASNPYGTGSEKRSAQIRALCEAAGFAVADMQPPSGNARWRARLAGMLIRWRLGRHASVDDAGAGLLGYRSLFYRNALARHRGARMLLWETTYDSILPTLARAAGYRIVALPHNLESLVSEAAFADPSHDVLTGLAMEIRRLHLADAIFTISKEERWLLEARGLGPHYLPFHPDPALADACSKIRSARVARVQADGSIAGPLLLVGSAFNPATERGMRWQLEQLRAVGWPAAGVVVIGPQTEARLAGFAVPGVRILGGVTWEELTQHLTTCSAMLIHTFGGAGAVTRIPEALLAGVPVIANGNAARDQYGTPGVHVYDDPAGFHALIPAALPIPPPPPRPVAAEVRFQSELRRLMPTFDA